MSTDTFSVGSPLFFASAVGAGFVLIGLVVYSYVRPQPEHRASVTALLGLLGFALVASPNFTSISIKSEGLELSLIREMQARQLEALVDLQQSTGQPAEEPAPGEAARPARVRSERRVRRTPRRTAPTSAKPLTSEPQKSLRVERSQRAETIRDSEPSRQAEASRRPEPSRQAEASRRPEPSRQAEIAVAPTPAADAEVELLEAFDRGDLDFRKLSNKELLTLNEQVTARSSGQRH